MQGEDNRPAAYVRHRTINAPAAGTHGIYVRYRTAHAFHRRYGRFVRDAGRSNAYQPARYYLYDGSLPARRVPGDTMTAKGVNSGDLHDLCIGGLLVCLTLLAVGRTGMLPDRGRDLPAAM